MIYKNTETSYGDLIYSHRKSKNLTQEELAEILKTSDKIISKWENENNFPSNKFLLKLCDTLEIEVEKFLKFNIRMKKCNVV